MEYFCPCCDEEFEIPERGDEAQCPHCFRKFTVDRDADFPGDGSGWRDLTRLIPQE